MGHRDCPNTPSWSARQWAVAQPNMAGHQDGLAFAVRTWRLGSPPGGAKLAWSGLGSTLGLSDTRAFLARVTVSVGSGATCVHSDGSGTSGVCPPGTNGATASFSTQLDLYRPLGQELRVPGFCAPTPNTLLQQGVSRGPRRERLAQGPTGLPSSQFSGPCESFLLQPSSQRGVEATGTFRRIHRSQLPVLLDE